MVTAREDLVLVLVPVRVLAPPCAVATVSRRAGVVRARAVVRGCVGRCEKPPTAYVWPVGTPTS